jgi:BirA family biotin operon repressor/biotin-[acetyl-CoA-carboxylase] ligase
MQLDPIAAEAGVRLVALATVGSTNQEAQLRSRRGERGPLWITAVTQTKGRGRMDRSWVSPPGNLYASLLLSDPAPFERAPELAFVAGLAVRDAIVAEAAALEAALTFKWPNDLLLASEKCAGILIEGDAGNEDGCEPGNNLSVVVGIGVNCSSHPPAASATVAEPGRSAPVPRHHEAVLYPATDLKTHGAEIVPHRLFQRLSATMCRRIAQWDRGRNFSAILGDWLAAVRGLGEQVTVRNRGSEKTGRFVGLDPSGRLVLELYGGAVEKISAGDVFPLRPRGGPRAPSLPG